MGSSGQKVKIRVEWDVIREYAIAHRVEVFCEMHECRCMSALQQAPLTSNDLDLSSSELLFSS